MEYYNLYKKGRYGWFHVTSFKTDNLKNAIAYYKKEFSIKLGREIYNFKVTGL
jgi:predicted enzyme related to lactoylglutathione lyase|tara:strand:+ start:223 stop:381 length:159 start_codon:yes stop_codon:yes gene_type:complete